MSSSLSLLACIRNCWCIPSNYLFMKLHCLCLQAPSGEVREVGGGERENRISLLCKSICLEARYRNWNATAFLIKWTQGFRLGKIKKFWITTSLSAYLNEEVSDKFFSFTDFIFFPQKFSGGVYHIFQEIEWREKK